MLKLEILPDGIVQVTHSGAFMVEDWRAYQEMLLEHLDSSDSPQYILTDFSQTARFDSGIVKEAGTARHLTHPNLGLIVLLGGNALHKFILQLTENRASKDNRGTKLRVQADRNRAIEMLHHFRSISEETAD